MKDIVRRVGQRFMVGFDGLAASADVKTLVRELGVGHIILFARNVERPEQVAELVRELQSAAREAGHERPLVVAVDQEGGPVARLGGPWTVCVQVEAIEGLIRAAEAGEIPFLELEAAEERVKRLQERVLEGHQNPDPSEAREAAGRGEHRELAEEIAAASGLPA